MKRKCTKCKQEKDLNDKNFNKSLLYSGGYTPSCKECLQEKGRVTSRKQSEVDNWTKLFIG
jgi:hypothetical protein